MSEAHHTKISKEATDSRFHPSSLSFWRRREMKYQSADHVCHSRLPPLTPRLPKMKNAIILALIHQFSFKIKNTGTIYFQHVPIQLTILDHPRQWISSTSPFIWYKFPANRQKDASPSTGLNDYRLCAGIA
ncbi:hypothetical protein [Corynebacterium pyruviciproducens]